MSEANREDREYNLVSFFQSIVLDFPIQGRSAYAQHRGRNLLITARFSKCTCNCFSFDHS